MKILIMAALLFTVAVAQAADPAPDDMRSLIEAQQKQIELLQQQLDATRASSCC